ncbi:MAG: hypothetical protein KME40_18100 [Komarekiella atlantica HA4396-MV6]|nr:hypothetical protein [Komarekiella atlantica HA4396-MV6]
MSYSQKLTTKQIKWGLGNTSGINTDPCTDAIHRVSTLDPCTDAINRVSTLDS